MRPVQAAAAPMRGPGANGSLRNSLWIFQRF
jgi:hypothetical protein